MKISLIQCPVWGTYDPPVALAQLSSCLKKEENDVRAFDLNIKLYLNRKEHYKNIWAWEQSLFWYEEEQVDRFFKDNEKDIQRYVKDIIDAGAGIIGFSVNAGSRLSSIKVARMIKRLNRDVIIVFGGPIFFEKRYIDLILNQGPVDVVIPGEGEVSFCELVKMKEKRHDISSCKGIVFNKNGKIVNTGQREILVNLDSLPFLDFTDLPLTDYDDSQHIPLMASRGCVQKCNFCSSRTFWPGYRYMSGERIFREIGFHKRKNGKLNPNLGHIDFLDLLLNGNMKSLVDFCDLMIDARLDIYWTANMIIRPEMTQKVIKKMKGAGCEHVIFGIESGSQRVLNLMKKNYRIEDADKIIRWMHETGITVTCNFMFGFPGETEEDLKMTLDFIVRNAKFLDRAYPSRTYCAIEEYSYLHSHMEEFGIKPDAPNHLYWESLDGRNTYPVRLQRCEEFSNLAMSLGIEVGCGVQTSIELDKWYSLGFYYEFKKDYQNAISCFLKYNKMDPANKVISDKVHFYLQQIKNGNSGIVLNGETLIMLENAALNVRRETVEMLNNTVAKLGREQSLSLSNQQKKDNSQLNEEEFATKKTALSSSPKAFFLQVAGPCNAHCAFCSRGSDYEFFDLQAHRARFERKIKNFLQKAEQIILTGSGEFLQLPNGEEVLDYFDYNFPQAEKMFSTNGSSLIPKICEKITHSKSKYTIHVSLHASTKDLHAILTRTDNFYKIIGQLNYLLRLRKNTGNPAIHLIFVATTLNIDNLPDFVRLAASLGVDRVICYYNYIYVPAQKYLSCFFKQEFTNKMLDEAERVAGNLNIKIDLPPRFGLKDYPVLGVCREAWSQVMLNSHGDVIPCDASEDSYENLNGKDFMDVWNSSYYKNLRQGLIEGNAPCFKHCFRANPSSVNDFHSHVIHRGKDISKINILWGDNF